MTPASTPSASGRRPRSGFAVAQRGARAQVQGSACVGARLLGPLPARDRSGARAAAGHRVGPPRGDDDAGQPGRRAPTSTLRALDLELDISQRTLDVAPGIAAADAGARAGRRHVAGRRASGRAAGVRRRRRDRRRSNGEIEQQENFISVLLGGNPGADRARPRADRAAARRPTFRPVCRRRCSSARPDIQQAEQQIVAANAQIGVARAAYFPQIALTGSGGFESTALAALFTGTNAIWTAAAVRDAADLHGRPHAIAGRARRGAATGGGDRLPADDPAGVSRSLRRARRLPQAPRVPRAAGRCCSTAAQDARRLAEIRYQGGATSYLEVLDADTRLFDARARPRAGTAERAVGVRRDLPRARRRMADVTASPDSGRGTMRRRIRAPRELSSTVGFMLRALATATTGCSSAARSCRSPARGSR